jgi:branched-chain amino acid transport system permease protein
MRRGLIIRAAAIAGSAALIVVLGFTMTDYHQYQGGIVAYYLIAILGLNILTGYTGQISLGNGAFMAVGGYTTAILCGHHGWGELWTIPVAAAVAGAAGLLFGIPALRLAGPYLALATFAIAVAVPSLAKRFDHFTGGSSGITLPIHTGHYLYWASWICAGIGYVVAWLVLRGRTGRAFRAVRDSEVAAVSSGVSLAAYKTLAFGISAAFAGVAGALLAIGAAYTNPDTFPVTLSLYLLIGAVVGGLGSLWGVVFGALFIEFLPLYAQDVSKQAPSVIYGLLLIAIMLVIPTGVVGLARRLIALSNRVTTRP